MSFSLLPLLVFEDDVPAAARDAVREAQRVPEAERSVLLEASANTLYREAHLDCADARELVGLD